MMSEEDYVMLLPQLGVSALTWLQLIFAMNRAGLRLHRVHLWAGLVSMHAGLLRWITALMIRTSSVWVQLGTGAVAAALGWTAFVLIFNQGFFLPTRQQIASLGMSLAVTWLWEVHNRILYFAPPPVAA